jgi:membrane-associated protein
MLHHLMPLIASPWLYTIIFVLVAIDGFVPVAMSEAVIIGLGAISAAGSPSLAVLAGAAVAGGVAGDRISYHVGGKASARIRNGKLAAAKAKAEQTLLRQGSAALVIGRFIPYGRTAVTLTAGSVRLPLSPFYLGSVVSNVLWAGYSIGLGRLGGVAFADSPILAAAFGIALGFLLAGLHSAAKRLRPGLVAAAKRLRPGLVAAAKRLRPGPVAAAKRLRPGPVAAAKRLRPGLVAAMARLQSPAPMEKVKDVP